MKLTMGPVLRFHGTDQNGWKVSALVVTAGNDEPTFEWSAADKACAAGKPKRLKKLGDLSVWRCACSIPQRKKAVTRATYRIAGAKWAFSVPAAGAPPRIAYASCNGFASAKDAKRLENPNAQWVDMARSHKKKRYHLLILGGDQVYADPLWESIAPLSQWAEKPESQRRKAAFTAEMRTAVEEFYFELYCKRWSQDGPARMLATIPTLMMWDDHDIFDGWGSYPKKLQDCAVYRGIFAVAREHFRLFQLHVGPRENLAGASAIASGYLRPDTGFSYAHVVGPLGLLTLDARSERSETRILGAKSWDAVFRWLDGCKGLKHLLVMAAVPVVYPGYAAIERVLRWIPGRQEIEDDLLDHWRSRTHRIERLRLIHRLLNFSQAKKCRVTILSGDVHLAALGVVESRRRAESATHANTINQLISSPVTNVPQPWASRVLLEYLARPTEHVDRGITARMLEFPGTNERFLNARNWLSITFDKRRLWAEWMVEGQAESYTKVIHPVG